MPFDPGDEILISVGSIQERAIVRVAPPTSASSFHYGVEVLNGNFRGHDCDGFISNSSTGYWVTAEQMTLISPKRVKKKPITNFWKQQGIV